jgi:hypothetical protein
MKGARSVGLLAGVSALLLAGCDTPQPVASEAGARRAAAAVRQDGPEQRFARALARAMARPEIRALVRNAMRESRFNENKLVLQEFAATAQGARVVRAVADAAGVDEAAVRGWIAQLPAMDFYAPLPEHRRSWRATADVVVGANMNVDEVRLTAYATDGSVLQLNRRDGIPARPVIILHPAEPKSVVTRRGGRTAEVIDADATSGYTIQNETGMGGECDPETAIVPCDTETGSSGGGLGPQVTITQFTPHVHDAWGDLEVMFKHRDASGNNLWEWITSGNFEETSYPNKLGRKGVTVWVWERDSGFPEVTGDDFMGSAPIAPSGTLMGVYTRCGSFNSDDYDPEGTCMRVYLTDDDSQMLTISMMYQY